MALIVEHPSIRASHRANTVRQRRTALQEAIRAELRDLGEQLARFSDIEAAVRLRALSELDYRLTTDALCGLAARAS